MVYWCELAKVHMQGGSDNMAPCSVITVLCVTQDEHAKLVTCTYLFLQKDVDLPIRVKASHIGELHDGCEGCVLFVYYDKGMCVG